MSTLVALIPEISSGIGLACFALVIWLVAYRSRLQARLKIINGPDTEDKSRVINAAFSRYEINQSKISGRDAASLIEKQLIIEDNHRRRQLYALSFVGVLLFLLAFFAQVFSKDPSRVEEVAFGRVVFESTPSRERISAFVTNNTNSILYLDEYADCVFNQSAPGYQTSAEEMEDLRELLEAKGMDAVLEAGQIGTYINGTVGYYIAHGQEVVPPGVQKEVQFEKYNLLYGELATDEEPEGQVWPAENTQFMLEIVVGCEINYKIGGLEKKYLLIPYHNMTNFSPDRQ